MRIVVAAIFSILIPRMGLAQPIPPQHASEVAKERINWIWKKNLSDEIQDLTWSYEQIAIAQGGSGHSTAAEYKAIPRRVITQQGIYSLKNGRARQSAKFPWADSNNLLHVQHSQGKKSTAITTAERENLYTTIVVNPNGEIIMGPLKTESPIAFPSPTGNFIVAPQSPLYRKAGPFYVYKKNGKKVRFPKVPIGREAIDISMDGQYILFSSTNTLYLYRPDGKPVWTKKGLKNPHHPLISSHNKYVVVCSEADPLVVSLFSLSGELRWSHSLNYPGVRRVKLALSNDGSKLLVTARSPRKRDRSHPISTYRTLLSLDEKRLVWEKVLKGTSEFWHFDYLVSGTNDFDKIVFATVKAPQRRSSRNRPDSMRRTIEISVTVFDKGGGKLLERSIGKPSITQLRNLRKVTITPNGKQVLISDINGLRAVAMD